MNLRILAIVLAMAFASGCGSLENSTSEKVPGMDIKEAAENSDQVLQKVFNSIEPPVRWTHDTYTTSLCKDFKPNGEKTGSVTLHRVVMTDVSEERRGSLLGVVERSWKKSGYKITGVDSDKEMPAIFASTLEDFRMVMEVGEGGQVFFSITTPCMLWTGESPRLSKTNGPNYMGKEIPRPPNHQDDFWSVKAPIKQQ